MTDGCFINNLFITFAILLAGFNWGFVFGILMTSDVKKFARRMWKKLVRGRS